MKGAWMTAALKSNSSAVNAVPLAACTRAPATAHTPPSGPNGYRYTSGACNMAPSGHPAARQSCANPSRCLRHLRRPGDRSALSNGKGQIRPVDRHLVVGQGIQANRGCVLGQRGGQRDVVTNALVPDVLHIRRSPGGKVGPPGVIHDHIAVVHQHAHGPVVVRPPEDGADLHPGWLHTQEPTGPTSPCSTATRHGPQPTACCRRRRPQSAVTGPGRTAEAHMGTWDVGPFSNDAAADLLSALDKAAPAQALDLLGETLASAAANDGYLDVDDGQAAVAAAAGVAAQRLGGSRLDVSTVPPWLAEGGLDIPQELDGLALAVLDRVLGEDSELRGLWEDSEEYHQFLATLAPLRAALGGGG